MLSVRFLRGARAGNRYYIQGELAGISTSEARRLIAQGVVAAAAPPTDEESSVLAEPIVPSAVMARVTKPVRAWGVRSKKGG